MRDEREPLDEVVGGLVDRLRAMPASDPRMRAAILARVRRRRQAPWRAALGWALQPSVPMLAAATIAVAAIGVGYAGRVLVEPIAGVAEEPVAGPALTPVADAPNAVRRVATQFILSSRDANRVVVVGDFNQWDETATPLQRLPGSGVWEATIPLSPGRHVYAYLVNDSLWTVDPRAQKADDPEFGRASSVILVPDR